MEMRSGVAADQGWSLRGVPLYCPIAIGQYSSHACTGANDYMHMDPGVDWSDYPLPEVAYKRDDPRD